MLLTTSCTRSLVPRAADAHVIPKFVNENLLYRKEGYYE